MDTNSKDLQCNICGVSCGAITTKSDAVGTVGNDITKIGACKRCRLDVVNPSIQAIEPVIGQTVSEFVAQTRQAVVDAREAMRKRAGRSKGGGPKNDRPASSQPVISDPVPQAPVIPPATPPTIPAVAPSVAPAQPVIAPPVTSPVVAPIPDVTPAPASSSPATPPQGGSSGSVSPTPSRKQK
jgi:hypothetical protein